MSKKALLTSFAVLAGALVVGLALTALQDRPALAETANESNTATTTFHVTGMTCGGCEVGVRRTIKKLDGVEEVTASFKEESAVVTYDPAKARPDAIVEAIEKLGYKARVKTDDGDQR